MSKTTAIVGRDLSSLALSAATELGDRLESATGASKSTRDLAHELRLLFPGEDRRPQLPPETTGLVCGVVESWEQVPASSGYRQSSQAAQRIAELLEKPQLTTAEIERLVQFCLNLFYATQPNALMHDVPGDHEHILSMC